MSSFIRRVRLLVVLVAMTACWGTTLPPAVAATPATDAQIVDLHRHYLGAAPDDLASWSLLRLTASTLNHVLAPSPMRQRAINEIYRLHLNRNLTTAEMQAIASSGSSHQELTTMVLRSPERRERIRQTYRFFMGADPSEHDLNGWAASGITLQQVEDQTKSALRRAAIDRMYVDYLGRPMTDHEWNTFWNPQTGSQRTATLGGVLGVVKADSAASTQRRDEIRRFYPLYLGRPPDGGVDTWAASQLSLPEIATRFQNLPEGRRYLIDQLYRSYFGRAMTDSEWNSFWNAQSGTQRHATLTQAEDIVKANLVDGARRAAIDALWQGYLGRGLTDAEWNNTWSKNGWSLQDVERFAIHHPDARRLMIDSLWRAYLGRGLTDGEWNDTWSRNQQQMPLHKVAESVRVQPHARRHAIDVLYRIYFGRSLTEQEWTRYWEPTTGEHRSASYTRAEEIIRVQYETRHHVIGQMYLAHLGRAMSEAEWSQYWDPSRGQHRALSLEQVQEVVLAHQPAGMASREPHVSNIRRALGSYMDQAARSEQAMLASLQPKPLGARVAPPAVTAHDGAVRLASGGTVPWSRVEETSLQPLTPGPAFVAATVCTEAPQAFVGPVSPSAPPPVAPFTCRAYATTNFWSSDGSRMLPAGDANRPATPPTVPWPTVRNTPAFTPASFLFDSGGFGTPSNTMPFSPPFGDGPSQPLRSSSQPFSSSGMQWAGSTMFGDPFAPTDFSRNNREGPFMDRLLTLGTPMGGLRHRYQDNLSGSNTGGAFAAYGRVGDPATSYGQFGWGDPWPYSDAFMAGSSEDYPVEGG